MRPHRRSRAIAFGPACLRPQKNSSLRAGFGAAIQDNMDRWFGAWPWIATSQALLAMMKKANAVALSA